MYDTLNNRRLLYNHFNNIYVNYPTGLNSKTSITCVVNGVYKNINVRLVKPGRMVKTLNGDKKVLRVIETAVSHQIYNLGKTYVYAHTGILVKTPPNNSICYGKINDEYIITAGPITTRYNNAQQNIMYNFVFDTTDEFTCYYSNGIPVITPIIGVQ